MQINSKHAHYVKLENAVVMNGYDWIVATRIPLHYAPTRFARQDGFGKNKFSISLPEQKICQREWRNCFLLHGSEIDERLSCVSKENHSDIHRCPSDITQHPTSPTSPRHHPTSPDIIRHPGHHRHHPNVWPGADKLNTRNRI